MPLNFSAAHSSRITKRQTAKNPLLRRSSSSPFTSLKQRKPIQRSQSEFKNAADHGDLFEDRLDDRGLVTSLATDLSLRDVAQIVGYAHKHMFEAIPERGGFNSTRIAEILNFRKCLPRTVTVAHVHAMTKSPTATEKEIAELSKAGIIRKIVIPGRGAGGSSMSEGLVLFADIEQMLAETGSLNQVLIGKSLRASKMSRLTCPEKFLQFLRAEPLALTLPRSALTATEATELMRAGFLTSASQSLDTGTIHASPNATSAGSMTSLSSISRAASGSMAAIGGEGAIHAAGGSGKGEGIRRSLQHGTESMDDTQYPFEYGERFQVALPNTGPYLRLLTAARSHLMALLLKSKYREMPLYLLQERWDGGVSGDGAAAKAKEYRGEFAGILPSRTRRWKEYYGLRFDWVLAECLGAGLLEVFETGSVGRAVRAV